ncbi:MAG: undecaprenyldiphospho-muramoylpentapeptide beta-N-acetylglucosaminyltransferase [Deltaproteobacteria bacterium]|nr:MAG: undecaprenyldiphospho-muramoylpentapeptide beta-N-acetylglucosaminyltransferase [Deltaproteobacteria bacterium]
MRLLLAGGGTGGHLFPAVALAERLRGEEPGSEVLFVGTERGLEYRLLPELGWPLRTIPMSGWAGLGAGARLKALAGLARSLAQSRRILREFRPDVVVGVGGYASVPVLLAARLSGVPYLIHEQNAWPGLANRLLGRWARRVCVSFGEAGKAFRRANVVLTGNPVRAAMEECPALPGGEPLLLVFGGSHGARTINRTMIAALPRLGRWQGRLHIVHQTGSSDAGTVSEGYRAAGWADVQVVPFITDMADVYARASLVVCRAGATTLAELTACGRPAVLIPYPHAANNHQAVNAAALASKGAAIMIEERDLKAEELGTLIDGLLGDRARLESMSATARSLAQRGAAARLLAECRAVAAGA